MAVIKGSVGEKSKNDPFDVNVVQRLLCAAATKLSKPSINPKQTEGRIDPDTKSAIRAFELEVMKLKKSDGKIRPNDRTWRRLVREAGEVDTNPTGYPDRPAGITNLSNGNRDAIFTTFVITDEKHANHPGYEDDPTSGGDDINILGNWEGRNIQSVEIPQLKKLGLPFKKRFHRKAVTQLLGLWQAWEDDGLLDRVITFDGAFNARYKRKAVHITANLSNHAWGTAFDINASTNRLGATPAIIWEEGCVFELVPWATKWGFYWGGWFGGGRVDGMHFEVRVVTNKALEI